jgi:hypothetical protein
LLIKKKLIRNNSPLGSLIETLLSTLSSTSAYLTPVILEKYVYINNNIMNINLTQDEWCVSDNIIYISVNTYILTYPIITTNIKLGSSIHPEHLINHENSNIVIRDIWEKHNCLHLFN